jgi:hypothetical protein
MRKGTILNSKLFFIFFLSITSLFLFNSIALSETITLTTYYPAPFGVYNELRLYPHNNPSVCNASTEGTMYYNSDDHQVYVCGESGVWQNLGWWRSDDGGASIYNTNTGLVRVRNNLRVEGNAHFTARGGTTVEVDGTVHASGNDLAEFILADKDVEAGDVVIIDAVSGKAKKAYQAYSVNVAGVISEKPGLLIGKGSEEEGYKRLVLVGQIPCKATTVNGPIKPGDFLISSSKPGYAMKADILSVDSAKTVTELKKILEHNQKIQMSIIGKALEPLSEGEGKVTILVE